jgi:hypothetical protein
LTFRVHDLKWCDDDTKKGLEPFSKKKFLSTSKVSACATFTLACVYIENKMLLISADDVEKKTSKKEMCCVWNEKESV